MSVLSRDGGEAVAVHRADYAQHHVTCAVDGQIITDLNPGFSPTGKAPDPDRPIRHLRDLGVDPAAGDSIDNPIPAALALAGRIRLRRQPWAITQGILIFDTQREPKGVGRARLAGCAGGMREAPRRDEPM